MKLATDLIWNRMWQHKTQPIPNITATLKADGVTSGGIELVQEALDRKYGTFWLSEKFCLCLIPTRYGLGDWELNKKGFAWELYKEIPDNAIRAYSLTFDYGKIIPDFWDDAGCIAVTLTTEKIRWH